MSKVISIEKLREMARSIIDIPDFNGTGTISIRVQKPRIMAMAAQGKIPNPLMGIATKMVRGEMKKDDFNLKDSVQMMELYCRVCMVEPSFEDMKDIITDDQMLYIFNWAMGGVKEIENFHANTEDGTNNNTSEQVSEKTE